MAYSISWDESSPAGASTQAATIDTEIQQLKQSVRERMNDILDSSTAWETDADNPKLLDGAAIVKEVPSCARVYPSGSTSLTNGVTILIPWDTENFDTDSYHDNSTNNSRLTIPSDGYYRLGASFRINSGGTAGITFVIRLLKNNAQLFLSERRIDSAGFDQSFSIDMLDLASTNDYYEIDIRQASGGNWTLYGGTGFVSFFQIERLYGTP